MRSLLILPLRLYQWLISSILPPTCRYLPSCSEYTVEAIERHGAWAGFWLGVRRILRCHPIKMLGGGDGADDLKQDISEMERMLEGYLAFARGEGGEMPVETNLSALLEDVAAQARRQGARIDLHCEGRIDAKLKVDAFRRCITNLVENAHRYGEHISIRAGVRGDAIEIVIDDDGPGIPEDQREDVFRPFFRLEQSRNPGTGGVGLGLSIARDAIQSHGGDMKLFDSPMGGLRIRIRFPI